MKKINLQVKVSYTVDFDCEVTDEILETLECRTVHLMNQTFSPPKKSY